MGRNRTWGAGVKGVTYEAGKYPIAFPRMVDHRYLETMKIPLQSGRYLEERDNANSEKVIVINETMARLISPDRDPLGLVLHVNGGSRVVGVVGDVRHGTLEEKGGPEMYLSVQQIDDWGAVDLVVRAARTLSSSRPMCGRC